MTEIDQAIEAQLYRDGTGYWCCATCNYSNQEKSTVKAHIEAKHVDSPGFMCSVCEKTCPTRHALKMHRLRKKHWYSTIFKSSFILIEIDDLVSSLMYKDENGKWVCNNCDYISYSSTSVREHVESKHIESQNYPCNICGHVCPTRKALKMHIFRNKHYS